jgi:hypothetical protein
VNRFVPLMLMVLLVPATAGAQPKATPSDRAESVEVDPIRCWWRTSAGSVRLAEPFDLSLTCAVLETAAVQVVPDESRLGNGVIAMAPFEVVTGSHPGDLHSASRRFFQYLYTLRLINADAIGKDVRIPDIQIHYRVNSKVAANTALQGRDLVYVMPPISVRVASMVPADAADIRDAAGEPFTVAEALDFRASVLEIVGIALVALGALMTLLVLVRVARGSRRRTPAEQRQCRLPRASSRTFRKTASSRGGTPRSSIARSPQRASPPPPRSDARSTSAPPPAQPNPARVG